MKVKFTKLTEKAIPPKKGSKYAAGYDLYSTNETTLYIRPHETLNIRTDIAMEIPEGYCGKIYARSGKSTKEGIRPSTCVSVIDCDYRGNIGVPVHNDFDRWGIIKPFERIAQIIIEPVPDVTFVEVSSLDETERGVNGFGSTGRH